MAIGPKPVVTGRHPPVRLVTYVTRMPTQELTVLGLPTPTAEAR
ncbi:hypothetical protein SGL43_07087 [Streptomyces globisporus]|uniref:Uncharacterized protein n=1 Tax=Streptomyces globisporus TaxID=1908 RepID=A0ABM9H8N0_STRGL|nr:hypothetical protein SGL43_07087 [Streptomyces globisporus]